MPLRSSNWAEVIDPQLRQAFWSGYGNLTSEGIPRNVSMIDSLFQVNQTTGAYERFIGYNGLGSGGWNLKDTGRVQADEPSKGWPVEFTHEEYAKAVIVQRKLIDDGQVAGVLDMSRMLGESAYRKREKGAASVFNNSFTAAGINDDGYSVTGPDGVALVSDSHPVSPSDSSTRDNKFALALTADNLSAVRVAGERMTDATGDPMGVVYDTLLVPPDLADAARVITGSALDPTTGNNAINPQNGRYRVVVWNYLTDTNRWFLIDSGRASRMLKWFDRIPLEFDNQPDRETHQRTYDAYGRWSYGWIDYSWIVGSEPS